MTSLPPLSPLASRQGGTGIGLGSLDSPMSATAISWSSSSPSLGRSTSTTISGGWNLQGRGPPAGSIRRLESPGSIRRLESPGNIRRSKTDSVGLSRGPSGTSQPDQLKRSRTAPSMVGGDPVSPSSGSPLADTLSRQERTPFVQPWRGASRKGSSTGVDRVAPDSSETPTSKYLRETELNFLSPKLIPFVTGHSNGLEAKNQALSDCDLLVMGTMVQSKKEITEVEGF